MATTRCYRCGKIASTRYPCKVCDSRRTMQHCHDRAHCNHSVDGIAYGYKGEVLGQCEQVWHIHPFTKWDHLNEPIHKINEKEYMDASKLWNIRR